MPSTVEQLSPSRVKLTVEVPFDELKPNMDKAYADIAQQITVPGFRKGKVPPRVIDQRFGRSAVLADAFNNALPQFYGQAVEGNDLRPLGQPDIAITKLEDGEAVEFTAEVDVRPDFELPDLTSISAEVDAIDVSQDQLDEQLDLLRQRFGTMSTVERAADDGDVVVLTLAASVDGEPLEDASAEDLSYRIGSGGMIEGLDEAVTGLSSGEENTFTSELVGGEHAGKSAEIHVTVSKVQEQQLPEVDDEFAQMASEFDTIDELNQSMRDRLTAMARMEQASEARDKVLEQVISGLDFEVPQAALQTEIDARHSQIEQQLGQAGMTLEGYLTDVEEGRSAEDFWAEVDQRAGDALKAQIVLDKIGEERDIQVDQSDLTQHILRIAQQNQQNPDEVAKHMVEHDHVTEYVTEIRRGKALAEIVEAATVTDSNNETVDLKNLRPDGTYADPDAEAGDPQVVVGEAVDVPADEQRELIEGEVDEQSVPVDGEVDQQAEGDDVAQPESSEERAEQA